MKKVMTANDGKGRSVNPSHVLRELALPDDLVEQVEALEDVADAIAPISLLVCESLRRMSMTAEAANELVKSGEAPPEVAAMIAQDDFYQSFDSAFTISRLLILARTLAFHAGAHEVHPSDDSDIVDLRAATDGVEAAMKAAEAVMNKQNKKRAEAAAEAHTCGQSDDTPSDDEFPEHAPTGAFVISKTVGKA